MAKWLIVKGDTNDADYIHAVIDYTKLVKESAPYWMDIEALLGKWINAMKQKQEEFGKNYFNNWGVSEYSQNKPDDLYKDILTETEISWINESLIPWGFDGIHDVCHIDMIEWEMQRLFTYRLG